MSRSVLMGGIAAAALLLLQTGAAQARSDAETKQIVMAFDAAVMKGDTAAALKMVSDDFTDHDPGLVVHSKAEFMNLLKRMDAPKPPKGPSGPPKEDRTYYVFGDNVMFISKRDFPDPTAKGKTYEAFRFDLFRVNAAGKVAEHWDSSLKRAPGDPGGPPGPPPVNPPAK